MAILRLIKVGKKRLWALALPLGKKNLIVLRGSRGYVMCGYLNLKMAEKLKEAAVKITGVSNIKEAISCRVHSTTAQARKLGIKKGQTIKDVLKIIA